MRPMRFRAPVPADAPAVLAVFEARDRADLGEVEHTLEDLRDEWRGSDLDLALMPTLPRKSGAGSSPMQRSGAPARSSSSRRPRGTRDWIAAARVDRRTRPRPPTRCSPPVGRGEQRLGAGAAYRAGYRPGAQLLADGAVVGRSPRGAASPGRLSPSFGRPRAGRSRAVRGRRGELRAAPDYVPSRSTEFIEELLEAHDFDAAPEPGGDRGAAIVGFLLVARRPETRPLAVFDILAVAIPGYQDRWASAPRCCEARSPRSPTRAARGRLGVAPTTLAGCTCTSGWA